MGVAGDGGGVGGACGLGGAGGYVFSVVFVLFLFYFFSSLCFLLLRFPVLCFTTVAIAKRMKRYSKYRGVDFLRHINVSENIKVIVSSLSSRHAAALLLITPDLF